MDKATVRALTSAYLGDGDSVVQWARHTGRRVLRLRISQPRDPDSNPYYPSNKILLRCIEALEEIVEVSGPKACPGPEWELLEKLCGRSGTLEEMTALLEAEPACGEYAYYATHDLVSIDRIAGGHRSKIENDTEIDISVYLMSGTSPAAAEAAAGDICRRHGVQVRTLSQSLGGLDNV